VLIAAQATFFLRLLGRCTYRRHGSASAATQVTWFPDAHGSKAPNESVAMGAIAITNDIAWRLTPTASFQSIDGQSVPRSDVRSHPAIEALVANAAGRPGSAPDLRAAETPQIRKRTTPAPPTNPRAWQRGQGPQLSTASL
jgi:hypothetical protein